MSAGGLVSLNIDDTVELLLLFFELQDILNLLIWYLNVAIVLIIRCFM